MKKYEYVPYEFLHLPFPFCTTPELFIDWDRHGKASVEWSVLSELEMIGDVKDVRTALLNVLCGLACQHLKEVYPNESPVLIYGGKFTFPRYQHWLVGAGQMTFPAAGIQFPMFCNFPQTRQWEVLAAMVGKDVIVADDLAAALHLHTTTVERVLQVLFERQLVKRNWRRQYVLAPDYAAARREYERKTQTWK